MRRPRWCSLSILHGDLGASRRLHGEGGIEVVDVDFEIAPGRKQATHIHWRSDGVEGGVDLGPDDLVFITIGSLTENSDNGDRKSVV